MASNLPNLTAQIDPDPVNTALQSLVGPTMNFLRDELQRSKLALNNYNTSISLRVQYNLPYLRDYVDAMAGCLMRCIEAGGRVMPNVWLLKQDHPRLEFSVELGTTFAQSSYPPSRNIASMTIVSDFDFDKFVETAIEEQYGPALYLINLCLDLVGDNNTEDLGALRILFKRYEVAE